MQVYLDDNGYVTSFAIIGNLVDGVEVAELKDLRHFQEHFSAYKVVDGNLMFDETKELEVKQEFIKQELRDRRQAECFAIIDRSPLWYDTLSPTQLKELKEWYEGWLLVTETLKVPEKPMWLH